MRKSVLTILVAFLLVGGVFLLWRLRTPCPDMGTSGGSSAAGKPTPVHTLPDGSLVPQNPAKSVHGHSAQPEGIPPPGSDASQPPSALGTDKKPDWARVSAGVKLIVGRESEKDYAPRIAEVHRLGRNLGSNDVLALESFLETPASSRNELDNLSLNAIKNDILGTLIGQEEMPTNMQAIIVANFRNKDMDVTWRDYCVQHFLIFYETRWAPDEQGRLADTARVDLMATYDEALEEPQHGIAGTALVGLERLSNVYPEIDRKVLGSKALQLLQDTKSDVQTRIAAMNVAGMTGMRDVLSTARLQAQTAEVVPLRLASIASIGQVGDAQDRELLEGLLAGSDTTVHKAAAAALKAIATRSPVVRQEAK